MKRGLLLMAMLLMVLGASAKKHPTNFGKGSGVVYLFGVSQELTDSMVYITGINQVDSLDLEHKTGFLPFRSEFSLQLKEYMEGGMHLQNQTTCVFYSKSRKKLAKKFYKIKKRFLDNSYTRLVVIDDTRFRFRHPLDSFVVDTEEKKD
ncbi:MAG: hypothetical protein J5616_05920 [Bacteroidaceae bacterium]|nr:hypothetical protein [Bacteroidaceae bacterium]